MSADPEAAAREWMRAVGVRAVGEQLHKAAGDIERGLGSAREALASPHINEPSLAERKARLLGLLRDAGALLVLEQVR